MTDEMEQDPRDPRDGHESESDVTAAAQPADDDTPVEESPVSPDEAAPTDDDANDEAASDEATSDAAAAESATSDEAVTDVALPDEPDAHTDDGAPVELQLTSEPAEPTEPDPTEGGDAPAAERPRMPVEQLKAIVESLVYASPEPLTAKMLFKLLADEPKDDVQAALDALVADYDRPGGLHLAQVAGGYQITTRPELHDWVRRLFHERSSQKLSVAALETLSVVAYRQPVTAAEANEIRGVNTSGVLSTLVERQLVKIVGRKNVVGRPFLYGTTKEFLVRFGLKDLNDLPNIQDMVQALGFDAPSALFERPAVDEMLPLDDDDTPPTPAGD